MIFVWAIWTRLCRLFGHNRQIQQKSLVHGRLAILQQERTANIVQGNARFGWHIAVLDFESEKTKLTNKLLER